MRLPIGLFIISIILSLSLSCHAAINYFTAATTLLKYGYKLVGFLHDKKKEEPPPNIKSEIDRLSHRLDDYFRDVKADVGDLAKDLEVGLRNLPGRNTLVATERYLNLAAYELEIQFDLLKLKQKNLNRKQYDFVEDTREEVRAHRTYIEKIYNGIMGTFNNRNALSYVADDFITSTMVYENVCVAKVSQLQLLEHLFIYFQITSSQFFFSKHILLNYFETYHVEWKNDSTHELYKQKKEDFNNFFFERYFPILDLFAAQFKNTSSKVWSCDSIEFDESNYLELKAYTKYYALAIDFADASGKSRFAACAQKCLLGHPKGPQNVLDDCMSSKCSKFDSHLRYINSTHGRESELRVAARDCPNAPIDCKHRPEGMGPLYICLEETSKTDYKRYTTVQTKETCIYDRKSREISPIDNAPFPLHCVCPENNYFISTLYTQADNGHLIVGAQIQMSDDNILYIKVNQGKPMEEGAIPITKWLDAPVNKDVAQQIIWGECSEFDLSEITLPDDRVVVGLGFTGCVNGRIHLRVISNTFNFENGTLGNDIREEKLIRGTKLVNLNNTEVPTGGRAKNRPIDLKKDGDYVKLALSNLESDAGQTTVPFIDIQKVVPAVPTALSGASLVLRTQPGYGGFLGIQLFTFNLFPHMPRKETARPEQSEIDEVLLNIT